MKSKIKWFIRLELECGCNIEHGVASSHEYDLNDDEQVAEYGSSAANTLAYWARCRFVLEKRHKCELVTKDNPCGLLPRGETND